MGSENGSTPEARNLRRFGTLVDMFDHSCRTFADQTALICDDDRISFDECRRSIAVLAARLREHGVGGGARVVVVRLSSIETSIAAHAVWAAGGQTVLLNPLYTEPEFAALIADAEPVAVLCDDDFGDMLEPLARKAGAEVLLKFDADKLVTKDMRAAPYRDLPAPLPGPDDPGALIYTGGTTGLPKAAFHTHAHLMAMVCQHDETWHLAEPGNVALNVAPQPHIWGLAMTLLSPLAGGNAVVIVPKFDPEAVLEALVRHRVTMFTGGPATIYHALMGRADINSADLSRLRYCFGGGSPFAAGTQEAWEKLTGVKITEGYGMTEGAPLTGNPLDRPPRIGSVGVVPPRTEVKVVDVETGDIELALGEIGELCFRGPQVVEGYWKRPDESAATFRGGWLHTGDIGAVDEEGFISIVDRKKDMAIVGGYNVYPREIDEVLYQHDAVQEAAVVGVPDDYWGEILHAFVVALPDSDLNADDVLSYCAERLAKFKVPAKATVADALPKTATNKIDKRALRESAMST